MSKKQQKPMLGSHIIDATFVHDQGYKFNVRYMTKGRFAAALRKSSHCRLDNAVDYAEMLVIKPQNLKEYLANTYYIGENCDA